MSENRRPERPLNVTLVICHLGLGGAQRVLTGLANTWASRGWAVTLLTLDQGDTPLFCAPDPSVRYVNFDWPGIYARGVRGARMLCALLALRRALKGTKPDVVLSFLTTTNIRILMAAYRMGVPIIVSERNDPHFDKVGPQWERCRRRFYPTAANVVAQTRRAMEYFPVRVRERGLIIPNGVGLPGGGGVGSRPGTSPAGSFQLAAMGRLNNQKGFDLLLEAFAHVAPQRPDWFLTIWGEGPDRSHLEAQVSRFGLEKRVSLPGQVRQPVPLLAQADLFVLSSRYEGFPNVLCEAMACGLPVISFDCPSGPAEIVRDGVDGILVPPGDVLGLAAALDRLMGDPELRARLASRAPEVLHRFSHAKATEKWTDLLISCAVRQR